MFIGLLYVFVASVGGCKGAQARSAVTAHKHGREELPQVRGQWQPGRDTPCPRSVVARRRHPVSEVTVAAERSYPASEASAAGRRHPVSEIRGG